MVPDYVNTPEAAYDWVVVIYFFLGGLGAGSFLVSVFAQYWKPDLKALALPAAIAAPVVEAIGMGVLLLDLGKPFRAFHLFTHFNPRSALSWGAWCLTVFFGFAVLYAWNLWRGSEQKAKKFGYMGLPFAILLGTYTGVLLSQAPGRVLWHTPMVPLMLLNGALISGLAAAIVTSASRATGAVITKAGKILTGLVCFELALIALEMLTLLNGGADAVAAAEALLYGPLAGLFLGLEVAIGLLVPIILLWVGRRSPAANTVAAALVLFGVFMMRYVVIVGGQAISF